MRKKYTRGLSKALDHLCQEEQSRHLEEFHYTNFLRSAPSTPMDEELEKVMPVVTHTVMLQLAEKRQFSIKQGIKKWGDRGKEAVAAELWQVHLQDTFTPKKVDDLSREERAKALESLMFLEEKRSGKIKGRICADGRKQRVDTSREEAASPTVMTDSVLITSCIEAYEEREVAVADLPGAYLFAEMDEIVHMVMRGQLAELMAETAPQIYRKYVTYSKNGEAILYVTLQKALYGCLKSALLFYRKLVSDMKSIGFELNPYDPCVANRVANGKQLTICWHVDDLKISHVDRLIVDNTVNWFKSLYGNVRVSRGTKHDYLGMELDFSEKKKVKVRMVEFLKKTMKEFPEAITSTSPTPAANHLFNVRDEKDRVLLDETRARAFHHAVAQLLFATIRCRRDIQTAVSFLCTRVKSPDEDDWKKLRRVLQYLRATLYLPLTLEVRNMSLIRWFVDASFAVHPDCKSHSGAGMTLGKGFVSTMSRKQKLNTRSSTEAELVGLDDVITRIIWTNYFIMAQGYSMEECSVFQDNQSAMLLEINGKDSSSHRTRHMNIKYFFATDRIQAGELVIKYCPTEEMAADHFTKPLQGHLFRKFRSVIMNVHEDIPDAAMASEQTMKMAEHSPQECVELPEKEKKVFLHTLFLAPACGVVR